MQRLAETQCGCTEAAIQVSQGINGKIVARVFNRKHIDCTGTKHTHKLALPGVQCTLLYNPHFAIQILQWLVHEMVTVQEMQFVSIHTILHANQTSGLAPMPHVDT